MGHHRHRPGLAAPLPAGLDLHPLWHLYQGGLRQAQKQVRPPRRQPGPGRDCRYRPGQRQVKTKQATFPYDWLVVATGCGINPEEVEGLMGEGWGKDIHNFYTLDGALALHDKMKYFQKGRVVVNIAELPFKCPVAPLEFCFMSDWFFDTHGVRKNIEIELVTPLAGAFTKPQASAVLGRLAEDKNVKVTPNFQISGVDAGRKVITSFDGREVGIRPPGEHPPEFRGPVHHRQRHGRPHGLRRHGPQHPQGQEF